LRVLGVKSPIRNCPPDRPQGRRSLRERAFGRRFAERNATLGLSEEDQKEVPIDRRSPYWTEIRILNAQDRPARKIPVNGGVFEVTLPRALFASNAPTMTLEWIDFFR
jgi:hypothetical protein